MNLKYSKSPEENITRSQKALWKKLKRLDSRYVAISSIYVNLLYFFLLRHDQNEYSK